MNCFADGARNTMIFHVVSLIVLAFTGSEGIESGICFQTRDVTEASIVFGGLFDVHQSDQSGKQCGNISFATMREVISVYWALDMINNNPTFLPGIKLGMIAMDTCGIRSRAAQNVISSLPDLYSGNYSCCLNSGSKRKIVGFIGPSRSGTAMSVARFLKERSLDEQKMVQILYSATAESLSNKTDFPFIFRTIASDTYQIKALLQIAKTLEWSLVAVIGTSDTYGQEGTADFIRRAKHAGICVITSHIIVQSQSQSKERIKQAIDDINHHRNLAGGPESSIGVVYIGQSEVAKEIFLYIQQNSTIKNLRFIMSDAVGTNAQILHGINGAGTIDGTIVLKPTSIHTHRDIQNNYRDVILSVLGEPIVEIPWLEEYVMEMAECSLANVSVTKYQRPCTTELLNTVLAKQPPTEGYVDTLLDAVYTLAHAINDTFCVNGDRPCKLPTDLNTADILGNIKNFTYGASSPDIYPNAFKTLKRKVYFDERGERLIGDTPIYKVNSFQGKKLEDIAGYKANGLTEENMKTLKSSLMSGWGKAFKSQCLKNCHSCRPKKEADFTYVPGRKIILGVFSIHQKETGFKCGTYRNLTASVQLVETLLFTVDKFNRLHKEDFGSLIFDDCYNSLIASKMVLDFFSGQRQLKHNGTVIDPDLVVGVIGSFSSTVTIALADILTPMKIPLISYASTASDLSNPVKYPYFLRTTTPNAYQVDAIIKIFQTLGWHYTDVLYTANDYARDAKELLHKKAMSDLNSPLCIGRSIEVPIVSATPTLHATKLLASNRALVMYADDITISEFLKRKKTIGGITGPLMVGSGAWGRSSAILTDYCNEAAGSLTLHVELIHIPDLKEHIQKLRVGSNKRNPWFFNFWQSLCKCYIPGKGMSKPHFEEPCSTDCNVPDDNFILDSWADKTYLATYALALGVQEVCKDRGKCNVLRDLRGHPMQLIDAVKNAKVPVKNGEIKVFDKNGNGYANIEVFNVQRESRREGSVACEYKKVGEYSVANRTLALNKQHLKFYRAHKNQHYTATSKCLESDGDVCKQCYQNPESDSFLVAHMNVVIGLLIACLLGLCILTGVLLKEKCFKKNKEAVPDEGDIQRLQPESNARIESTESVDSYNLSDITSVSRIIEKKPAPRGFDSPHSSKLAGREGVYGPKCNCFSPAKVKCCSNGSHVSNDNSCCHSTEIKPVYGQRGHEWNPVQNYIYDQLGKSRANIQTMQIDRQSSSEHETVRGTSEISNVILAPSHTGIRDGFPQKHQCQSSHPKTVNRVPVFAADLANESTTNKLTHGAPSVGATNLAFCDEALQPIYHNIDSISVPKSEVSFLSNEEMKFENPSEHTSRTASMCGLKQPDNQDPIDNPKKKAADMENAQGSVSVVPTVPTIQLQGCNVNTEAFV